MNTVLTISIENLNKKRLIFSAEYCSKLIKSRKIDNYIFSIISLKSISINSIVCLALFLTICCSLKCSGQTTERKYLSGTDKDYTVPWEFYCTAGRNSGKWTTIPVPSQWELQGFGRYNYGLDWKDSTKVVGHEIGIYKHSFRVPSSWKEKSVQIVFEGVMTDVKVMVNGQQAGPIHEGAFYSFSYDISDLLKYGEKNLLIVSVCKHSTNKSINQAERHADFWIFGGIFRPVYLEAKPAQHITRVAIDAKADGNFSAHVYTSGKGEAASLSGQVQTMEGKKVGHAFKTPLNAQSSYRQVETKIKHVNAWSPEFPHLYNVVFTLKDRRGHTIHKVKERFGFRTVEVRKGQGFFINGKKIRFKGVNYHSFWPSSGRTISKKLVIKDLNLIKDMNMNAVRMSHYPRVPYFYDVADSLGLFVVDELAGWVDSYETGIGRKLLGEMVAANVNHPSIVMWNNGNEGGWNFDLDDDFAKWDSQKRPVNHPGGIFRDFDSHHYPSYQVIKNTLAVGSKIFFPDEFLHAFYDGGAGAGLQDDWRLMRNHPRAAGGFIWAYVDECVERTDKGGRLDCSGNNAPDGIVGPYRHKEGSYYAIRAIWSPVQIKKSMVSAYWDKRLWVGNRYFYTNLDQVKFSWQLVNYPGPFDKSQTQQVISHGQVPSPNIVPQSSGFLQLDLPSNWEKADALRLKATDPHGRDIYQWTLPIKKQQNWVNKTVQDTTGTTHIKQTESKYLLRSNNLTINISKETGYITKVQKNGRIYSLNNGPFLAGDSCSLKSIDLDGKNVVATFLKDDYRLTYSLKGGWFKLTYRYHPEGEYPYFGIGFKYPEEKVQGIRWLGHGPNRVWKNREAGMELGLWSKQNKLHPDEISMSGEDLHLPKFGGYYGGLRWANLQTTEGAMIVVSNTPNLYLGLLRPDFGSYSTHPKTKYPHGNISFMQVIAPIGSKLRPLSHFGASSQPNLFRYGHHAKGHIFNYKNTLWFYFGNNE